MSFADHYLTKHKPFIKYIEEPPSGLLLFSVVIPAYLEDKTIITLKSIKDTIIPKGDIEVFIVINYSVTDTEDNKVLNNNFYKEIYAWCRSNSTYRLRFFPLLAANLPSKHAGAGLARKIGMDQALERFNKIDCNKGLILSLDADTVVDKNYFKVVENKMCNTTGIHYGGCIFYFEHTIEGNEFEKEVYEAVTQYELHLRYYKYALKFADFPFYHYTIGSCFGVCAEYYAQQGGMNRRQGAEDFYFLHKLFPHKSFIFINETCIHPSPRPSNRVPFGTGPAIANMIEHKKLYYLTYSPQAFFDLKALIKKVSNYYKSNSLKVKAELDSLPAPVKDFLTREEFYIKIEEINQNSASVNSFVKRFFQWFDGFMVVRFLNFSHQKHYKKIPVEHAVDLLFNENNSTIRYKNSREMLKYFRELDKA